jgi:hypothetical protein
METSAATPSTDAVPTAPPPDYPEGAGRAGGGVADRTEFRLQMLARLAEFAMDVAAVARQRVLDQAAREQQAAPGTPDEARQADQAARQQQIDFARAARTVRQTLALQEKIEADHRAWQARGAAAAAALLAEAAAGRNEAAQRADAQRRERAERVSGRIRREVERALDTRGDPEEAEELLADLDDWLANAETEDGFGEQPFRIALLKACSRNGIPASWTDFWDDGDPAIEEAEAEALYEAALAEGRIAPEEAAPDPATAGREPPAADPVAAGRGPPDDDGA